MRGGKGGASGGSGPLAIPAAHAMQQMLAALFGRPRLVLVMLRAMWWEGGREEGSGPPRYSNDTWECKFTPGT